MIIGIDTESSYTKDRNIQSMGVHNYIRHPKTHHILVGAYCSEWASVMEPDRFPWQKLEGAELVSHNRTYDKQVIDLLRDRGLPIPHPKAWHCSADLAAWSQLPRNLEGAAKEGLGIELDKTIRDQMEGVLWTETNPDLKEQFAAYCLLDAKASYLLWQHFSPGFPEHERWLSEHTTRMCSEGIGFDIKLALEYLRTLETAGNKIEKRIPWTRGYGPDGEKVPPTSTLALKAQCKLLGLDEPPSTDADTEEFQAWLARHGDRADFARAMGEWRSANRLKKVIQAMIDRSRDEILYYDLKYFGSITGRWAGSGGVNMLNLPREALHGCDARKLIIPRPGHKFLIADLSQIEARCALWLAKDQAMLDRLAEGEDLYESYSRLRMGYHDPRPLREVDPRLRAAAKVSVLSCQYRVGAERYRRTLKQWAGLDINLAEAKEAVAQYRDSNPGITNLWKQLDNGIAASDGGELEMWFPTARTQKYFDVGLRDEQWTGKAIRGEGYDKLYSGVLLENLASGTARDILGEIIRDVEDFSPMRLHVHDEIIIEVPENSTESRLRALLAYMRQPPSWANGLPIDASGRISESYAK
jgi:hypothetical protein